MKEKFESIPLVNNTEMRQFEISVDGKKAFVEYQFLEGKMYLTHAEVPEAMRNQGIGEALADKIMDYLDENKIALVPMCSFIKHHLRANPSRQRLLATGLRV